MKLVLEIPVKSFAEVETEAGISHVFADEAEYLAWLRAEGRDHFFRVEFCSGRLPGFVTRMTSFFIDSAHSARIEP